MKLGQKLREMDENSKEMKIEEMQVLKAKQRRNKDALLAQIRDN